MYILLLCLQDKDTCASMTLDSWMAVRHPQHWIGLTLDMTAVTLLRVRIFDPHTLYMNLTSTRNNAVMLKRQRA